MQHTDMTCNDTPRLCDKYLSFDRLVFSVFCSICWGWPGCERSCLSLWLFTVPPSKEEFTRRSNERKLQHARSHGETRSYRNPCLLLFIYLLIQCGTHTHTHTHARAAHTIVTAHTRLQLYDEMHSEGPARVLAKATTHALMCETC